MKAYFRAVAAWFSDPVPAQATAGVTLLVMALYTGYNIPGPYMIGALHWITYINVWISCHVHYTMRLNVRSFSQPLKYAYESVLVNEFRTLNLECSNLVPQGPGYENITLANQVCIAVGAIPGQTAVNGLRYLELSLNYEWSHMWKVRSRLGPTTPPCPRPHIPVPRTSESRSLSVFYSLLLTSSSPSSNPNSPRLDLLSRSSAELHRPRHLSLNLST